MGDAMADYCDDADRLRKVLERTMAELDDVTAERNSALAELALVRAERDRLIALVERGAANSASTVEVLAGLGRTLAAIPDQEEEEKTTPICKAACADCGSAWSGGGRCPKCLSDATEVTP